MQVRDGSDSQDDAESKKKVKVRVKKRVVSGGPIFSQFALVWLLVDSTFEHAMRLSIGYTGVLLLLRRHGQAKAAIRK